MTICSYDNTGQIKFDVDIEMEQGYWNTSASRLWTRIRDLMHNELVDIYKDMRANGMSYESFMSYFYDQQIAQIPQSYYNKDADVKYLPFADAYIGKAHGDGYEHLKRWLKNRLIFTDTLFDYQPSYEGDILTIRANTTETMTLEIETYTPVYQHLSWYNGQMDKKKIDGKISVSFSGKAQASTDQEILIYGGTNVKSIKGISTCNPSQLLIGSATRLTELDSSNSPILTDINSDNANLLPHIYLNNLNLSDCVNLSGILKINNSPLIKNVDISNTQLTELQLPSNLRNLEELKLSDHIRKLDIKNAELLTTLGIPSNIEHLSLINMPKLSSITSNSNSFNNLTTFIMENPTINPISNVTSKAPNLQYVRLIGLNISCSSSQVQSLLNMKGIDSFGNEIPIGQAVSGKITLPRCSESMERQFKEEFPLVEFIVNSYAKSYTVTFVDGDGNLLYITQVLENGEAVYVGGIPTKTPTSQYTFEYKGWDRQLKPIVSDCTITATFDKQLRYYTIRFINSDTQEVISSQYLAYGSTVTPPTIPEGFNGWKPMTINNVTCDFDYYTQYIPYPEDLSIFNFTQSGTGYEVSLKTNVEMPAYIIFPFEYEGLPVHSIEGSSSYSSTYQGNITDIYIPETVTNILDYAFKCFGCSEIILSSNVRYLGSSQYRIAQGCFNYCKATRLVAPGVQHIPSFNGSADYGGVFSGSSLKYIVLGSKEYPFKSWSENSANVRQHLYGVGGVINEGGFVNLITENGIKEDVSFSRTGFIGESRFMFSKTPVKVGTTDDGFSYISSENVEIKGYSGTDTIVTIPNEIDGVAVTNIANSVFEGNATITKVIAPSATSLGDSCFYGCTNLTSIELPLATSLGISCFYGCSKLTSIELPLATSLGISCFYGCSALTSIELPSATSLGSQCFMYCAKVTSINSPNVTSIGNKCFYGCSALTSIELPLVTSLGMECFYSCSALTSIEIPLVASLGEYCFERCSVLASIDLPSLTSLGNKCFTSCNRLKSITFGYIGKPIIDTSNFKTTALTTYVTTLTIYVTSPSSPPTLTGSPWGATNATITYEQA